MTKKSIISILVVVLAIFLVKTFFFPTQVTGGQKAPEITEDLVSGESFSLEDLKGKFVLIDFWGSWCAPCRRENPKLVKLYKQFENAEFEDIDGFEILSIAVEKRSESALRAIEKDNLYWPYHIVQQSRFVLNASLAKKYGVTELPTKFLINEKGEIVGTNMSIADVEGILRRRLKES